MKDLRSENDNLKLWRAKKATLTENLLKKSLEELVKLKAVVNQKTVCEMMNNLANDEDREYKAIISPSAISKNELYKNMIFTAKEKVRIIEDKKQKYSLDGDKQLQIFQLKSLIAKKEAKIKELESIIDRADIQTDNVSIISDQPKNFDFKNICLDLKNFILQEGIGYIDNNNNLIDESTGDILISSSILEVL